MDIFFFYDFIDDTFVKKNKRSKIFIFDKRMQNIL